MDVTFFFKGRMKREEVASAILATLLQHRPDFRAFFLDLLRVNTLSGHSDDPWQAEVEAEGVDIRLSYGNTVILIENKLHSGAVQVSQLRRYFEQVRRTSPHCEQVVAVYLAPGTGTGLAEVQRAVESPYFRRGSDSGVHLDWQEVLTFRVPENDRDCAFIESAWNGVRTELERPSERYPLVPTRQVVHDIMREARLALKAAMPRGHLRVWRHKRRQNLCTAGTRLTVRIDLKFEVDDAGKFAPVDLILPDGRVSLVLSTSIKLSGKLGRRDDALRKWWRELESIGQIDVPGLGSHALHSDGWFRREEHVEDCPEAVAARVVTAGTAIFENLADYL